MSNSLFLNFLKITSLSAFFAFGGGPLASSSLFAISFPYQSSQQITEEQFNRLQENGTLWMWLNEPVTIEFLITSFQNLYVASPEVDNSNIIRSSATLQFPKLSIGLAPLSVGETNVKVTSPDGRVKPLHAVVMSASSQDLD